MATWEFLTVPDELLPCAELAAGHFETRGYAVSVERSRTEFPYTPTLHCKRKTRTVIVEVARTVDAAKAAEWSRFAKSTGADTRIVFVLPSAAGRDSEMESSLRELGVGLAVTTEAEITDVIEARDIALGVELPERARLAKGLRRDLGHAYDLFEKSEWREGFEEMCKVLEACARRRLKDAVRSRRITVLGPKGKVKKLRQREIDEMPMGALKNVYMAIQNPNRADSQIGKALATVNPDRIKVAHKKKTRESQLRQKIGPLTWLIVGVLREAC